MPEEENFSFVDIASEWSRKEFTSVAEQAVVEGDHDFVKQLVRGAVVNGLLSAESAIEFVVELEVRAEVEAENREHVEEVLAQGSKESLGSQLKLLTEPDSVYESDPDRMVDRVVAERSRTGQIIIKIRDKVLRHDGEMTPRDLYRARVWIKSELDCDLRDSLEIMLNVYALRAVASQMQSAILSKDPKLIGSAYEFIDEYASDDEERYAMRQAVDKYLYLFVLYTRNGNGTDSEGSRIQDQLIERYSSCEYRKWLIFQALDKTA